MPTKTKTKSTRKTTPKTSKKLSATSIDQELAIFNDLPEDYNQPINSDDIHIPSVVLLQRMTDMPELNDVAWKPGEYFKPVTDEHYKTGFEATIIHFFVTVRIFGEKDPKTGRSEIERFSSDGVHWDDSGEIIKSSEFKFNRDGGTVGVALKSFHYLVLIKGEEMPCLLTFKGASAKFARKLNFNLSQMRPAWRNWIRFTSIEEESNGNKYYVIQFKNQPKKIIEAETHKMCLGFWKITQEQRIQNIEMTPESEEPEDDTPTY